jgi:hypothetical protein
MTVLLPFRAEFGAILFYFYISDRTSLLGESKKVPPLNLCDGFFSQFQLVIKILKPFMCYI